MDKKIYIATIVTGQYEDSSYDDIFASFDKDKVIKWCDKFNSIIDRNRDRISKYYENGDYDKKELFWYDFVYYNDPLATFSEVEYRE